MDVRVRTGQTKPPRDTHLAALSLQSAHGEHVCLLLEVHGSGKESKTIERECENVVQHALLETEGDAAARLDGTLKELNGLLKGFTASGSVEDVHMIIAILDRDRVLHASHAGRAEGYLVRRGLASQITEYVSGKPVPAFVHIASGQIETRDVVVFSTQRLLRAVTPAQLAQHAQHEDKFLDTLIRALEGEGEHAALAALLMPSGGSAVVDAAPPRSTRAGRAARPSMRMPDASGIVNMLRPLAERLAGLFSSFVPKGRSSSEALREHAKSFLSDLTDPKRKKRAHLLLLAAAVGLLVVIWATVHLFTSSQRSKTRVELESLVEQINVEIQTADNRRIIGDIDAANAILQRAEERAKQVMDNESGLFRVESLDLLERIRSKKEEINNVIRLSPRVVANIGAKTPDIDAQGIIGLADGEFTVYDRQDAYRVILNAVEDPQRISEDELLIDGVAFDRFSSLVFLTTGNSVVEMIAGQPTVMKTEDPAGWVNGADVKAYLRFLYILSPENKQIYKYERLSNRYGAPVGYNVNGDLSGALDMAIDGNVFVLKEGGTVIKLFRGELQSFVIRRAPDDLLKDATKVYKVPDSNLYFLDPVGGRVIMVSDGGATGEASYVRQYVLEGDQIGELKGLYVDPEEAHLYVLDEKRVYVVDLGTK